MKRFGLIGFPIAHSLSPALFKAAYGGKYVYDLIEEKDFETAWRRFIEEYDGINVTAPFKEQAFRKSDVSGPECTIIGAANILTKEDDGEGVFCVRAENSDAAGVIGAIKEALSQVGEVRKEALVIGCGGAGKAAVFSLLKEGWKVNIINRDIDKAIRFAHSLRDASSSWEADVYPVSELETCFKKSGAVIYTIPAALPGLDRLKCDGRTILLEANYRNPAFTDEIVSALKAVNPELHYVSGKEWLLHQAVDAFLSFTGEAPNIEKMRKVL